MDGTLLDDQGALNEEFFKIHEKLEERNIKFDIKALSKKLGTPIVPTIAAKNKGIDDLIKTSISLMEKDINYNTPISYGENIDNEVQRIKKFLVNKDLEYPNDWIAVKLLEGDEYINQLVSSNEELNASYEFRHILEEIKNIIIPKFEISIFFNNYT